MKFIGLLLLFFYLPGILTSLLSLDPFGGRAKQILNVMIFLKILGYLLPFLLGWLLKDQIASLVKIIDQKYNWFESGALCGLSNACLIPLPFPLIMVPATLLILCVVGSFLLLDILFWKLIEFVVKLFKNAKPLYFASFLLLAFSFTSCEDGIFHTHDEEEEREDLSLAERIASDISFSELYRSDGSTGANRVGFSAFITNNSDYAIKFFEGFATLVFASGQQNQNDRLLTPSPVSFTIEPGETKAYRFTMEEANPDLVQRISFMLKFSNPNVADAICKGGTVHS